MIVNEIDRTIYDLTFRKLRNEEYINSIDASASKDIARGVPELYVNIFLKLLGEFSNDSTDEFSKLPHLEQLTAFRGKNILEIGCNVGYLLNILTQLGADCYGVDIINFGPLLSDNGITYKNINLLGSDVTRPSQIFPEAGFDKFDAVMTRELFEYPVTEQKETKEFVNISNRLSKLQIHECDSRMDNICLSKLECRI